MFYSGNVSLGIAVLCRLAKEAASYFPDADIEIVEAHHNRKVDAPSGTAKMLFSAIQEVRPDAVAHCGRAGTQNQMLTLRHEAMDRGMLADGGVAAARFLAGRRAGLYNMESILEG